MFIERRYPDQVDSTHLKLSSGSRAVVFAATGATISSNLDSESEETGYGFPVGSVFRAAPDAVIVMDAEGLVQDWNPAAEQVFGHRWEDAVGKEVAELVIPGPLRDAHRNALRRYLETGEPSMLDRRVELSALRSDGWEFPIELTVSRLPGADRPLFVAFIRELRERSRTEHENARLQQRMAFLAQAWFELDSTLEFDETLHRLAELVVPELAEIAVVDLLEEGGTIRTAVAAAADPEDARALETMRREHPLRIDSPHPVASVLRTGHSSVQVSMSSDFQRQIAEGPEHYELMRKLGYHSAVVVPLVARRRVLGTLSLLRTEASESYEEGDAVLAGELARRAALAVDNSRMFALTRDVARTLQDSLLPDQLPAIPGTRVTPRYRAAAQGQEVGGDFYDVFAIDDGHWGIAIGDVCGKGPEAAALTAFARYTLRALAVSDPAVVLEQLNEIALRDPPMLPDQLVTILFAVASVRPDGLAVDVATAGHPAPLARRADGSVERLRVGGPLIGLIENPGYQREQSVLGPGDALLLYTDGLTDARAPAELLEERDLVEFLRRARGLDGGQLADFLMDSATRGEDPHDDIALLLIERLAAGN